MITAFRDILRENNVICKIDDVTAEYLVTVFQLSDISVEDKKSLVIETLPEIQRLSDCKKQLILNSLINPSSYYADVHSGPLVKNQFCSRETVNEHCKVLDPILTNEAPSSQNIINKGLVDTNIFHNRFKNIIQKYLNQHFDDEIAIQYILDLLQEEEMSLSISNVLNEYFPDLNVLNNQEITYEMSQLAMEMKHSKSNVNTHSLETISYQNKFETRTTVSKKDSDDIISIHEIFPHLEIDFIIYIYSNFCNSDKFKCMEFIVENTSNEDSLNKLIADYNVKKQSMEKELQQKKAINAAIFSIYGDEVVKPKHIEGTNRNSKQHSRFPIPITKAPKDPKVS